jgi:hypothetical protein
MIPEVPWDLRAKGFIQALDRIETRKEKGQVIISPYQIR